jgi:endonuclease YncB( thermonuclease family)
VPRRTVAALIAAVSATVLAAAPATPAAAAATCRPDGGPACHVWTGKVAWVADGDTLLVDVAGDGTRTPRSIRLIGVQSMEQTVYSAVASRRRGECHALAATARVEQLVRAGGGTVRMTAQKTSSASRSRPLRSVAVKINGRWRDIGYDLLRYGYAMWWPDRAEYAWNSVYRRAAQQAAGERRNLYDTDYCGTGPMQSAKLSVQVNYDATGADDQNINGEWIKVANASGGPVQLGGWWVRDSALRRYTFPAGTAVPARGAVYVHVGKGRATATRKYWGLTAPAFDNPTSDALAIGDGGYLFDPRGDLRAWMIYPCVVSCTTG